MASSWQRSLIFAGVGATLSLWFLENLTHTLGDWLPAIVIGSGIAWVAVKFQKDDTPKIQVAPLSLNRVQNELVEAKGLLDLLAIESQDLTIDGSAQQLSDLRSQINQITSDLNRDEIRFAVMGGKSVGKTMLVNLLQHGWAAEVSQKLVLQDTPELFAATDGGIIAERDAWKLARSSDVVLFVTNGDLTATEFQAIQQITGVGKRLVLILNKQDQYLPEVQQAILNHLRERMSEILAPQDVIAIATNPKSLKIRQHRSDGTVKEWLEKPEPQLLPLLDRLNQILLQEGQQLVLASSLSNVTAVQAEAKTALNRVRRDRAVPRIDQAQWLVAGTAFANPFPALDLLATAAINGQMVLDLSNLYQRKFTLDQAKTIAATMASVMVKLGLVEVSTQAIASILKTNAITFVAGGLIQGVSAAYLTRMAGLTLIEYFEGEPTGEIKPDLLQQIMQKVFEQNRRLPFLQMFVKQAVDQLVKPTIASSPQVPKPLDSLPAPQEAPLEIGAKLEEDVKLQSLQPLAIPEPVPILNQEPQLIEGRTS
ncbi:MAG: DUF697 domain-containing protein [Phormidium tanganyikae FI6-MK23]|jgi:hypothetical protein|nr:DUF697 domain-containing protein [Phormidium tanganyikae FI6-MK23]